MQEFPELTADNVKDFEVGPRVVITTAIPFKMKEYLRRHGIKYNFLIYKGFEWLAGQKTLNAKLQELQSSVESKLEAISKLNERISMIYRNFEEIKKKYNLPDDVKLE